MAKLKYYKRHRMELELRHARPAAELPPGYYWVPWEPHLLELHAEVKYRCFAGETDVDVFPCLGTLPGCRDLMYAIVTRPAFCPEATWMVAGKSGCVATVQGLLDGHRYGGIQNLGVLPDFRGLGIGRAVLLKALAGFAKVGVPRAFLEVTASNLTAVRMYRQLGFRNYKTLYREVEPPTPVPIGVGI